jgi:hypothetical protein
MHEGKSEKLNRYDALFQILSLKIPEERLIRDPLRTLAYGTDASFYRLTPKLVVRVQSEDEVAVTVRFGTMLWGSNGSMWFVSSQMGSHPCSLVKDLDRGWSGAYLHFLLH